ncbi:hypothetical protein HanRHA438_Chr17g0828161 [Helianthus annuus]|nr:hypothetical protein HanRHA438_Chr17g0828161 [Helianthus annuus]
MWHEGAWCMGPVVMCAAHQSEPIRRDCVACSYRLTGDVAHARMEPSQCGARVHGREPKGRSAHERADICATSVSCVRARRSFQHLMMKLLQFCIRI